MVILLLATGCLIVFIFGADRRFSGVFQASTWRIEDNFLDYWRYDFILLRWCIFLFFSAVWQWRCRITASLDRFLLGHVRVYGYPLFREAGFGRALPLVRLVRLAIV